MSVEVSFETKVVKGVELSADVQLLCEFKYGIMEIIEKLCFISEWIKSLFFMIIL